MLVVVEAIAVGGTVVGAGSSPPHDTTIEIGLAPSDGRQVVLDARPESHDHFVCTECGTILDIALPDSTIDLIQGQLGRNLVRDGIVVRGRCERCGPLGAGNPSLQQ